MRAIKNKNISNPSLDKLIQKTNSETEKEQETGKAESDNNKKEEDFNELPYTEAVQKDKRNICSVFKSILLEKIELLSIFCVANKLKVMLILEYLLSFLFNFFFNALLYSDEVVSNKYHNNGKLDFIVTIVLSILSNIITSIICFYLNYTRGFDERWELITELKIKKYFIKNVRVFFKFLKIKYVGFFILEIALIGLCYYYIVIFFIIYSRSKGSLTINYLTSLIEGLITSIGISIIILLARKIGLACLNKHIYNASKFINNKF